MPKKTNKDIPKKSKQKKNRDGSEERRPKLSISTRLFFSVMGIVLSFIITIILVDTRLMNSVYIFSTAWQLWDLSGSLEKAYEENEDDILSSIALIEHDYGISMEIFDPDDHLLYSSDNKANTYGVDTDQSLERDYTTLASSDIGTNRHFEIQRDFNNSYQMEYIVYVASLENGYLTKAYKMKTPMDEGVQVAIHMTIYTALFMIFFAAIMIRVFSLKFTQPLKKISSITHNMARLDFSKKCPPSNSKEISLLSESINNMGDSLNDALEDLKQKNQKLMDDFEKEKTLEHLRYDFISGVSHELKTPIAIIQGYAEGMELFVDSDPETAKQYAHVIIGESDRMHTLVMKLLEIIKYDSGDYIISREEINLYELLQDWFNRDANLLKEKEIRYENNIPQDQFGVGDTMLLGSVVNNYLSNGVSHIDGERILKAWTEDMGDAYRVCIFNTGKHIENKDIDKIWSSFYRADKSMSRAEGRFGLGLAIVSSIQRLHERAYGVENIQDGVMFWFDVEKTDPTKNGL